jgi:phospholipase C
LVISPYAKRNFVDNTLTDQSSILRFIEDNWSLGQVGDQSMDALAGTLTNMFNFHAKPSDNRIFLSPTTGERESERQAYTQFTSYVKSLYVDAGVQMSQDSKKSKDPAK